MDVTPNNIIARNLTWGWFIYMRGILVSGQANQTMRSPIERVQSLILFCLAVKLCVVLRAVLRAMLYCVSSPSHFLLIFVCVFQLTSANNYYHTMSGTC
jgi:hypothetical protein